MNTAVSIFLAVSSVITGQILLKIGMSKIGRIDRSSIAQRKHLIRTIATQKLVIAGFLFYGASSILWIYVLSSNELSFAYPFLSIAYVGVPTAAGILLKEKISTNQFLGIGMVVTGVIMVATSR